MLRALGGRGNQVLYSTHASSFLSVAHLDELALVRHRPGAGTALSQPLALPSDESFRALAEFDAERAELFLSRAALLVEGVTEKLVFPFVFEALGYEPTARRSRSWNGRQGEHAALRAHLQRVRDPVRRRPRPGRAARQRAERVGAGSRTPRSARSPARAGSCSSRPTSRASSA